METRKAEILRTIDDLPVEDQELVTQGACLLYTMYDASQAKNEEELVRTVLYEAGGDHTKALRAVEFFEKLESASIQDTVGSVAAARICGI